MVQHSPQKIKKKKFNAKSIWRLTRRIVFNPNESPKKRAQSVALASFLAFTPLYGVQTYIGIALAFIFRLNKVLVVVLINIITPYPLVPFIIYLSFKIGGVFVNTPAIIDKTQTFSWQLLGDNLVQYLSGGFLLATVMGTLLGLLSYPLFVYLGKRRANKMVPV
jgi:uncharacterized protein (DUF2062 family)